MLSKTFIISIYALLTTLTLSAQEVSKITDFSINIENSDDHFSLRCEHGCIWKKLSFNLEENDEVTINEFGVILRNEKIEDNEFRFLLKRVDDNLMNLKGQEGTAWLELNFTLSNHSNRTFDAFGTSS